MKRMVLVSGLLALLGMACGSSESTAAKDAAATGGSSGSMDASVDPAPASGEVGRDVPSAGPDGPVAGGGDRPAASDVATDAPLAAGSKSIGAAGGDHAAAGAQLSVPAGALMQDTVISMRTVTSGYPALPAGDMPVSAYFALEPHGLSFAKPVTLTIPYTGAMDSTITLLTAAPAGAWMAVAGATVQATTVQAAVSRFSFFVAVKRPKKALWEQVFGKWDCTAGGRPAWAFEVIQKTQFGSEADWVDLGTGAKALASVQLTSVYLKDAMDKPYRNFEYKTQMPEVLASLLEWTLTANGQMPYSCLKR